MSQIKANLSTVLTWFGQTLPGRALVQTLLRLCRSPRTGTLACRMLDHPALIMLKRGAALEPLVQQLLADPYDERTAVLLRAPQAVRPAATPARIEVLARAVSQHPDARPAALCLSAWLVQNGRIEESIALNRRIARGGASNEPAAGLSGDESLSPSFLIIGMPKSGTTSLFNYLAGHPQFKAPIVKEIRYWSIYYEYGRSWYLSHFPPADEPPGVTTGEATVNYIYDEQAPARIAASMPGMKIMLLVRNPVDRAYSHYLMNKRGGDRHLPWPHFVERELARLPACPLDLATLRRNRHSPLALSVALPFIERWRGVFPANQMLILPSEQLFTEPQTAVGVVTGFLGLDQISERPFSNVNPGVSKPMDPTIRRRLNSYYAPYRAALEEYLQVPFDW